MIKVRCPICDQLMTSEKDDWPFFPFCCERCKTIDLGRWLDERYAVPSESDERDALDDSELP